MTARYQAPFGKADVYAFYEWNPHRDVIPGTAKPRPQWYAEWIREWPAPAPFKIAGFPPSILVKTITLHRKAAPPFLEWLQRVYDAKLWHVLRVHGGDYNFRLIRGGVSLSMHALGGATDHDPARNPLGAELRDTYIGGTAEGLHVVKLAEECGLRWGGRFARRDAQHFQFAEGY